MQESCPFWPAHIILSVMGNETGLAVVPAGTLAPFGATQTGRIVFV